MRSPGAFSTIAHNSPFCEGFGVIYLINLNFGLANWYFYKLRQIISEPKTFIYSLGHSGAVVKILFRRKGKMAKLVPVNNISQMFILYIIPCN